MRSLRATLLVGLVGLLFFVAVGMASVVYARGHQVAHDAVRADLKLRVMTLAGLAEIEGDGLDFELPERALPEYFEHGSGVYATIHDHRGKVVIRSPSLDGQALAPNTLWTKGVLDYDEIAEGPDGIPCAAVTYSFVVRAETIDDAGQAWDPPPEAERRFQARVAIDSRPRDGSLVSLGWFLAAATAVALLVGVGGGLVVSRLVLDPVERMTAEAKELTPSDRTRRLDPQTVVSELRSLAEQFNSAIDRQADALERQRRFSADASHELRTPITVLKGNAELLLRRDRTDDEYREGLETQLRVATRMHEVVNNLLMLARSDASGSGLHLEDVSLKDLLGNLCDEFQVLAVKKGVRLGFHGSEEIRILGDKRTLGELFQNLLSNGIKFTPPGGGIDIRLIPGDKQGIVEVADTGPGIPPASRPHVFDRFFRVEEGKNRSEGAGLGLAIVEAVVLSHGGKVAVRQTPGGGATFVVRLPAPAVSARHGSVVAKEAAHA